MKNKLRFTGLALAAIVAFSLTACGSDKKNEGGSASESPAASASPSASASEPSASAEPTPAETVKLKIGARYFDDDTKLPYDYAIAELKKEMPNVELELVPSQQDDNQKLKTQMATGDLPDIVDTDWSLMQVAKKSNNLLVLDNEAETATFKEQLNKGNESKLIAPDGHVYAYPYAGIEFQILYYNKKMFEDAGIALPIKTIDQLKEVSKKFVDKGIIPLAIFSKEKWIGNALLKGFMTREEPKGYGVLNDATEIPESLKLAAGQIGELQAAGLFAKNATNTNYDQASALFYQGKAAMFINGQWEIPNAHKNMGDGVDWMYWPAKDEATYESTKFAMNGQGDPSGFAVSGHTKNKEIAIKVAAFMARKYAEYKFTMVGNPIVSIKIDKPAQVQMPKMLERLSTEVIPNITSFAEVLSSPKVGLAIDDNSQNLLVSGFTLDQFVKNMNQALKDK
ncbi:ABC transporter substrate-binding protein [Cohnella luojiensis]|uniref:Extracellular solute-binding protein n=1 Tax=Cohnella luojiensis TaxID=652876 RepID=A0A4Y8LTM0_9BACL|nr:extracellular solute-binding protein [Cohnella luojiensis]TFE23777.1 extracellular solute-binding protein [Cohnella luojiensis]